MSTFKLAMFGGHEATLDGADGGLAITFCGSAQLHQPTLAAQIRQRILERRAGRRPSNRRHVIVTLFGFTEVEVPPLASVVTMPGPNVRPCVAASPPDFCPRHSNICSMGPSASCKKDGFWPCICSRKAMDGSTPTVPCPSRRRAVACRGPSRPRPVQGSRLVRP